MFTVQAHDETWGCPNLLKEASVPTYADAKSLICSMVDENVKLLLNNHRPMRVRMLEEVSGNVYQVLLEWSPDGELAHEDASEWDMSPGLGLQCAVVLTAVAGAPE